MKNPFILMAMAAASALAAFRERVDTAAPGKTRRGHDGSKRRYRHAHNPAGSKLLRRFYKAKTGLRGTYREAVEHYAARKQ